MKQPNATYRHIVLEGTAYECGLQLGGHIRGFSAAERAMYAELRPGQSDLTPEALARQLTMNDRYCPGVNDELKGMARGLDIPMERLCATLLWHTGGACSHIAALPGATADGHVLAARSYEWSLDDALCLITTRVRGKFAHIGFSIFGCGRFDGLNEQGLCVTMSAGAPGKQPTAGGYLFWAGIRAALDTCATVEEALRLITAMPSGSYDNIILSDRQGHAALIENACGVRAVRRIGPGSTDRVIWSTNHYELPGMAEHGLPPMWMSTARHARIGREFAERPQASRESLKALLAASVPDGLCCHHYTDWFGTLWSIVFDVTAGTAEICFGPPDCNDWHVFGLDGPAGVTTYPALLPDEPCTDPGFFSRAAG